MRLLLGAVALALFATTASAQVTCTSISDLLVEQVYLHIATCNLTSSYTTGGDSFTTQNANSALCGSSNRLPLAVNVQNIAPVTSGAATARGFSYDSTSGKFQCWFSGGAAAPMAECTAATNNSAIPLRVVAYCK